VLPGAATPAVLGAVDRPAGDSEAIYCAAGLVASAAPGDRRRGVVAAAGAHRRRGGELVMAVLQLVSSLSGLLGVQLDDHHSQEAAHDA
jgi:hypothetical protein